MRFFTSLFALTLLTGCPAEMCPPDGTSFQQGAGLGDYCAYRAGNARTCPASLPNRFDFADTSFVCSNNLIATQDAIPANVCAALPACAGDVCATLVTGAPCTDFGMCRESGCRWRQCISGVVTVVVGRCDAGVDWGNDAGGDASSVDAFEVDASAVDASEIDAE